MGLYPRESSDMKGKSIVLATAFSLIGLAVSGCATSLVNAGCDGDVALIQKLLKEGARINQETGGYSALSCAIRKGQQQTSMMLISIGADPNIPPGRYSPLMYAVENGNLEIVKELIRVGANVDTFGDNGITPLGKAANKGNADLVDLLVGAGADIDKALTGLDLYSHYYDQRWYVVSEVQVGKGFLSRYSERVKATKKN